MKKISYFALFILAVILGLILYRSYQRQLHTIMNHILNPSPAIWNDTYIYYQDELICKRQDNGLLFMAWGGDHEGFVGVGKRDNSTAQQSVINIKNSSKYEILNESETLIDGRKAMTIECINKKTNEYTLFIFVIEKSIMILYSGPKQNLPFFQKTMDGIKFVQR